MTVAWFIKGTELVSRAAMTTARSYFATTLAWRKIQILDKREKENILLTATNFPQNVWHLIANFTSANACPGDESENYGFIKRILSSEEAHVWRRICLDWHLAHVCCCCAAASDLLPYSIQVGHPGRRRVWERASVCKLETVHHLRFVYLLYKQHKWGSLFLSWLRFCFCNWSPPFKEELNQRQRLNNWKEKSHFAFCF